MIVNEYNYIERKNRGQKTGSIQFIPKYAGHNNKPFVKLDKVFLDEKYAGKRINIKLIIEEID